MTVLDNLIAVRNLINTPEKWCQGVYRSGGRQCLEWAVVSIAIYKEREQLRMAMERLVGTNLIRFNDTHTHAEVLAVVDRAIAEERGK